MYRSRHPMSQKAGVFDLHVSRSIQLRIFPNLSLSLSRHQFPSDMTATARLRLDEVSRLFPEVRVQSAFSRKPRDVMMSSLKL